MLKGEGIIAHPSNLVRRIFHFPLPFRRTYSELLTCPAEGFFFWGGGVGGGSADANERELRERRLEN